MLGHHVIISGTGRTGTTFLVKLLTQLGLDTGFTSNQLPIYENCNAGLEKDLLAPDAPYIVKSPWICDYIESVIANDSIIIDRAFIPIRDLAAAAESRKFVTMNTDPLLYSFDAIPGGLWHTTEPEKQEEVLANQLYKLVLGLSKKDIPITFINYPKLVKSDLYLFTKLLPILQKIDFDTFSLAFRKTVDVNLVHQFNPNDL